MREGLSGDDRSADRAAIHAVVHRYCRAVDRLRLDDLLDVYAPDGVDHHTGFDGGVTEYRAWVEGKLTAFDGTQHILGNHHVDFVGDGAIAETYGNAVHWGTPSDDPALNFTSGFRYVDHFARTDVGWRIAERWAVREWTRDDSGRFHRPEGMGPRGRRDDSDPLFALQRSLLGATNSGGTS